MPTRITVRATVLIVDDDREAVDTMRDILVEEGHKVVCACNGQEALERVREALPDLILLDLDMPVMGGREFLALARGEPAWKGLPIVVISGSGDRPATAEETIMKPLRLDTLLDVIERVARVAG